jgi:hypothetical protein
MQKPLEVHRLFSSLKDNADLRYNLPLTSFLDFLLVDFNSVAKPSEVPIIYTVTVIR